MVDGLAYCAIKDTPYWKFQGAGEPPSETPDGTIPKGGKVYFPRAPDSGASYASARLHRIGRVLVQPSDFAPC